jgi:GTP-binding protein
MSTLMDFRYRRVYRAEAGEPGRGKRQTGKSGADRLIPVPVGTVIRDDETGELLADLATPGQTVCVARGGRGGRGNWRFAGPARQAPMTAGSGRAGEERTIQLELKLLADVGLVGLPNAGKSTLLSRISAARPRIAAYPFTTLRPMLGVVKAEGGGFVVADIPGIIEGAHEGKGMGLDFLRHIERTMIIAVLVDVTSPDPAADYRSIRDELRAYDEALWGRPHCLVLTKCDLLPPGGDVPDVAGCNAFERHVVSAVSGRGIGTLIAALARKLGELRAEEEDAPRAD